MRIIYSFFMYLSIPYLLVRLWWKGRSLPAYRRRIAERFAYAKSNNKNIDIWLHAVSLGEVIAATPLIDALIEKNWSVLITTTTPTGSDKVQNYFGNKIVHQYLPYDLSGVLKRFFKLYKPQLGIIMETELWPNLLHQAHKAKIPLLLANARLSEYSVKGYVKLKFLFKPLLNQFAGILAQSEDDAQRYLSLGVKKELVKVLGNIKFDLQTKGVDSSKFEELKSHWGAERTVVIAASTHEGEESQIIHYLKKLQKAIPEVVLLIAPRHPERFQTVFQLCQQAGFNTGLRSAVDSLSVNNEIVVLDCLGELLGFYQISDFAFIGGSLVTVGGHNVLEPIAMKVPVLSGSYVHNFKTICNDLVKAEAIHLVDKADELIDAIITLHNEKELQNKMVKNATAVLENNKGALLKHLNKIESILVGA